MQDEPPFDFFSYDEYWDYEDGDQFRFWEEACDDSTVKQLRSEYSDTITQTRKARVWKKCEQAGVTVVMLAEFLYVNPDNLRRSLQVQERSVSWETLEWACRFAGIDFEAARSLPDNYRTIIGVSRAAMGYRAACRSVDHRLASLAYTSVPGLSPARGALLWSIMKDIERLAEWIHLSIPFRNDFSRAVRSTEFKAFVESIYAEAIAAVAPEPEICETLGSWAPDRAGWQASLGRLAQAWNPYQLFWHVAYEETKI